MNYFYLLFFMVLSMACDSAKELPKGDTNKASYEEKTPNLSSDNPNQKSGIPGGITFKAKVLEVYDLKKNICGVSRANVVQLEFIEILEQGSSLTKLPSRKEILLVSFLFDSKDLRSDIIIKAKAKESRCRDGSKSYFIVNSYEILE